MLSIGSDSMILIANYLTNNEQVNFTNSHKHLQYIKKYITLHNPIYYDDFIKYKILGKIQEMLNVKDTNIPLSVKKISFDNNYNGFPMFSKNITYICFGNAFNRPITIPDGVTTLHLGNNFNSDLILPNSLTYLNLNSKFKQKLNLPDKLEKLIIHGIYNNEFILPDRLKYIYISKCDINIILPPNLISSKVNKDYLNIIQNFIQ